MYKNKMAQLAQADTIVRAQKYVSEIYDCIQNTIILDPQNVKSKMTKDKQKLSCSFIYGDAVSAAFEISPDKSVTILSFSSYKNPGGGYIKGIISQEESLCHESFLYNVLRDKMDYYNYNAEHSADCGYYDNRAMWIPNVRFFHLGKERLINIITCAAPQVPLIKRHRAFDENKLADVFSSRIKFVCDIIQQYPTDIVILGAFGCGFHANSPYDAGHYFKTHLQNLELKSKIIFTFTDENKEVSFHRGYNNILEA